MIDIYKEELIKLTDAVTEFGPFHDELDLSTLYRWKNTGCNGVKLETVKVAGKRYTSTEAIERFLRACAKLSADN